MTEGWAIAIYLVLLGLLMLVGIGRNASMSHDDAIRHRGRSDLEFQ